MKNKKSLHIKRGHKRAHKSPRKSGTDDCVLKKVVKMLQTSNEKKTQLRVYTECDSMQRNAKILYIHFYTVYTDQVLHASPAKEKKKQSIQFAHFALRSNWCKRGKKNREMTS